MKFKFTPDKLMIGLFAVIMVVIPAVTIALPKAEKSENENRTLAKMPTLVDQRKLDKAENPKDVWDAIKWKYITNREGKAFKDDFETFFCDHLVGREMWVKSCNTLQRLSGQREINGVYTEGDRMIQLFRGGDRESVDKSIAAINAFAEKFPDKQVSFMLAPTSQEVYGTKIPSYMGISSEKAFIEDTYKKLEGVTSIDCQSFITGHGGEYIFYRTDHHWTSLGAYYAYQSAAKTLGYNAYSRNMFNVETAGTDFHGTLYSKTLDDSITPDTMDYYHLANGEPTLTMTCVNGADVQKYDSLYVREFLDQKDKYSSFTGSNVPIVTIETDVDNDKSLLIIKDSYAHSLVPFLSNHYSKITMIDMRYINTDISRLVKLDEYQQVMFMYNVITFSEDNNLPKLSLTKGSK